jgi:anaerobic magnesium-protoporphyrin IX monomethyl ester cyclase
MALVLLVQPPIEDFYLTKKRTLPYGLLSISAALQSAGFDTHIIDSLATEKSKPLVTPAAFAYLDEFYGRPDKSLFCLFHKYRRFGYSFDHIALEIRKHRPFLVGISSLFTAYHDTAMAMAAAVRHRNPGIPIVMGGHHPTLFPEQVIASPFVDYVLRGEGEDTLPLLCRALKEQTPLAQVPGIAFQTPEQQIICPPHWTSDLSCLALPDSDKTRYYRRNHQDTMVIVSSRGCPLPCSYCSVSAASSHGRFRKRSVSHVIREIGNQADNRDIGFIDFEDENISFDRSWFLALLAEIKAVFRDRPVELRAMNGLFPPSLDPDLIAAMADAGFKTLNLSVGSVSKEQLKRFRRPDVRASHDRAVAAAHDLGLACVSYVIAGAPDQVATDSLEDLLYLASRPTLAGLSVFYPAPGSRDYDQCRRLGILPDSFVQMRSSAFPLDHTTTRIQAVTLLRLCRILNYMKHLVDQGADLPAPRPAPDRTPLFDPASDRHSMSAQLLQWFLFDGRIRGVDKDGQVYVHKTDPRLCRAFARAMCETPPSGTRKKTPPAGYRS